MNRRMEIAQHWLLKNKNGIPFLELMAKVFAKTCAMKAKPYILTLDETENFIKVKIKSIAGYLYYPKAMSLQSLYQVIAESTDCTDWHYYEIPETRIQEEDIVVDCGAAEGLFSLMAARKCTQVYAIEPLPQFIQAMQLTFSEHTNVRVMACALSDKEGESFITDHGISSVVSKSGTIPVKLNTIDNLFFKKSIKVTYLKADLEGFEMDMLKGAAQTINAYRPKIAITTYHVAAHAQQIKDFLLAIYPSYHIKLKGIEERAGAPVMLHAWSDEV